MSQLKKEFEFELGSLKQQFTTFGLRLELIYNSLVGNEIAKDGGLVKDIHNLQDDVKAVREKDINSLHERIEVLEKSDNKKSIYVNIIYLGVGAVIAFLLHRFNVI